MESLLVKLCCLILFLQVLSLVLSFGKLWMMNNVRCALSESTTTTLQAMTLIQQYHDLYAREGHEVQQTLMNVAKVVAVASDTVVKTVSSVESVSDSGGYPKITGQERSKAFDRIERHDAKEKPDGN